MFQYTQLILSLRERLGYPISAGCCNGFAIRWIEAHLADEERLFDERMHHIASYGEDLISLLNAVKEKNGLNLTEEDERLLDIHGFLDHLELQHSPEKYTSLFGQYLHQSDIESISHIATSDTIRHRGGICKIYSQPGVYSHNEIQKYLSELQTTIDSSSAMLNETWRLILAGIDHTVALTYQVKEGWRLTSLGCYPPIVFAKEETDLLAEKLVNLLKLPNSTSDYIGFNTSIFTTGDNVFRAEMAYFLEQFQEKQVLTQEMFERDVDQYDLAFILVQNKQASILKEHIAKRSIRLDKLYHHGELIHFAVMTGAADIIELLCLNGVDPELSASGYTPVYLAAINGDVNTIQSLVKYKANLDKKQGRKNTTPLYEAACNGHIFAAIELIQQGADANLDDDEGITPLHIAVKNNDINMVVALAKCGADVSLGDHKGCTPLHNAVTQNNILMITELLNYKADPNKQDIYKMVPLHIAAAYNDVHIIKELVCYGATLDICEEYGFTPLHSAILENCIEAVFSLVEFGADVNKKDGIGRPPLFLAIQRGSPAMVSKLISAHADLSLSWDTTNHDLIRLISEYGGEFVERANNVLINMATQHGENISISPYQLAFIMNNEEIIGLLAPNNKRKFVESGSIFFLHEASKKTKNESPPTDDETPNPTY